MRLCFVLFLFRLLRVRERHEYNTKVCQMPRQHTVSLHSDYAVYDEQLTLCRVQRILLPKKGRKHQLDYREPVPYNHEFKDRLKVVIVAYEITEQSDSAVYLKSSGAIRTIPFSKILSHINITCQNGVYTMPTDEFRTVSDSIKTLNSRSDSKKNAKKDKPCDSQTQASTVIRETIRPKPNDGNRRASQRVRYVVTDPNTVA